VTANEAIDVLKKASTEQTQKSAAYFGVRVETLGVRMPVIRQLAKEIKRNHALAIELWDSGIHEARILASLLAEKKQVTSALMDKWVADFRSWDLCDQTCINLFVHTDYVDQKIAEWTQHDEEFIKRTGFVLIACSAVHRKKEPNELFLSYLLLLKPAASDARNFVKKAVNWALRQIGKRNTLLHAAAIECAESIAKLDNETAKWIARDALRELHSKNVNIRQKEST
jgi:3-methyladenine DNA glycosylase AlkD